MKEHFYTYIYKAAIYIMLSVTFVLTVVAAMSYRHLTNLKQISTDLNAQIELSNE